MYEYPKQTVEGVVAQGIRACVSEAQGRGFKSLLSQTDTLMTSKRILSFGRLDLIVLFIESLFMPRSQRNDNFIDKTFTVVADILLKVLPTTKREKEAFSYYRDGMSAQAEGEYAEALQNYYEAMRLEIDPYDRSYILYNIGLIHTSNGEHAKALEYYYQALERNPSLPQALNNIAVIYHYRGEQAIEAGNPQISQVLFDKAADYWKEAIRLAPTNYIEAQNWLQITVSDKNL
jgi:tetratricopeptide (TPR) repeat protein